MNMEKNLNGTDSGTKKFNFKWVAAGLVLLLVVGSFLGFLQAKANARSEAVHQETSLSAQYDRNRIALSNLKAIFYSSVSVANLKSEKMDKLIEDAVKGRYQGQTSAQPGNGTLFSAIHEAYPEIGDNFQIYDRIVQTLTDLRQSYAQDQIKLRDLLRSYDLWRNDSGFLGLHPWFVRLAGVPTDNLTANLGDGTVLTGADAERQMKKLVLTSDAQQSYDTGIDTPEVAPHN